MYGRWCYLPFVDRPASAINLSRRIHVCVCNVYQYWKEREGEERSQWGGGGRESPFAIDRCWTSCSEQKEREREFIKPAGISHIIRDVEAEKRDKIDIRIYINVIPSALLYGIFSILLFLRDWGITIRQYSSPTRLRMFFPCEEYTLERMCYESVKFDVFLREHERLTFK